MGRCAWTVLFWTALMNCSVCSYERSPDPLLLQRRDECLDVWISFTVRYRCPFVSRNVEEALLVCKRERASGWYSLGSVVEALLITVIYFQTTHFLCLTCPLTLARKIINFSPLKTLVIWATIIAVCRSDRDGCRDHAVHVCPAHMCPPTHIHLCTNQTAFS